MTTPHVQSNVQRAVPFFWVRSIEESVRFYVDGLGCKLTKQWVDEGKVRWCWLELGDAALMLQAFWREGQHRNVPATPVGVGVSINFSCDDAVRLYHEFRGRGLDASRPMVGNGMWTTQVKDPDGYDLFFESPTDAPEESVLPEDA